MANDLFIPQGFGTIAAAFGGADAASINGEASAGIMGGFAVISIKGKEWAIKYRGDEIPIPDETGEKARWLDVVIVKTSAHLSKVYYPGGYVPGSNEAPVCSSANAIVPDVGVSQPQSVSCKSCPHDVLGSRITENGKKAKGCADSKRAVVVPYPDMQNEAYGGPVLLRIPAASLQELSGYVNKLQAFGAPYCAVVTRLRFTSDAFPKLTFQPLKALDNDEVVYAMGLRDDPQTARILNESESNVAEQGEGTPVDQDMANIAANIAPAARQAPPAPPRPAAPPARPPVAAAAPAAPPVAAARPPVAAARPPVPVAAARPPVAPAPAAAGPRPAFGQKPATIAAAVAAPVVRPPVARPAAPPEEAPQEDQVEWTEEAPQEEAPQSFMGGLDDAINSIMGG
jgi:hypothetical protein